MEDDSLAGPLGLGIVLVDLDYVHSARALVDCLSRLLAGHGISRL